MKRREFVATMSATVVAGISGCSRISNVEPKVSIFMTKKLRESINKNNTKGSAEEYVKLTSSFVSSGISGLSTKNSEVNPEVTVGSINVDQERIKNSETEDPLGYWNDDIYNLVPEETVSQHSNLLLCKEMPHPKKGYGEYPDCCNREVPTSMVYNVNAYFIDFGDGIGYYEPGYSRLVSLHEVCHNLGLKHDMGVIKKQEKGKFSVTPMMAGYVDEFTGDKNHFDTQIPEVPDEANVLYKKHLNDSIEPTELDLNQSMVHP